MGSIVRSSVIALLGVVGALLCFTFGGAAKLVQAALLAVLLLGWAYATKGIAAAPAAREAEREARLKQAVALAGDSGLTEQYYSNAGGYVADVLRVGGGALAVGAVALVVDAAANSSAADPHSALSVAGAWLSSHWAAVLGANDPRALFVWGSWSAGMLGYWGVGVIFAAVDLGIPQRFRPFRMQEEKEVPTVRAYLGALPLVCFNWAMAIPITYAFWPLYLYLNPDVVSATLPGLWTVLFQFICFIPAAEVVFWPVHYLLHTPIGYSKIHYIHHHYMSPFSLSSAYAHPVEFLLSNIVPFWIGPVLCGAHVTTFMLWAFIGTMQTSIGHSGYQLPLLGGRHSHDFHHSDVPGPEGYENLGLSGSFATLDSFFGTNARYLTQWQAQVDRQYTNADYCVDKVLAMHGTPPPSAAAPAPGVGGDAEAGDAA